MATDFTESFPHGGPGSSIEAGGQCGAADVAGAAKGKAQAAVGEAQGKDRPADASPGTPRRSVVTTGMGERAGLLGGRLEIDSEPAVGTRMRLEAPLANARS